MRIGELLEFVVVVHVHVVVVLADLGFHNLGIMGRNGAFSIAKDFIEEYSPGTKSLHNVPYTLGYETERTGPPLLSPYLYERQRESRPYCWGTGCAEDLSTLRVRLEALIIL